MKVTKDLLNASVAAIDEYVPGKSIEEIAAGYGIRPEAVIKLGSNENQLGPPPMAAAAVSAMSSGINIYPSVDAGELRSALAKYVGFPEDCVVMGAGMDGVVDTLMKLFIRPGVSAIITTPTFSYYEIAVRAAGGAPVFMKRQPDFSIDADAVISTIDDTTSMIFLCSPNNPSGNTIPEQDVRKIVESTTAIVFLDEAYVEFSRISLTKLAAKYENLVVGRTMSKAMGLAGLRIGYGILPEWLSSEYMKVTTPFAISRIAVAAGLAALQDTDYLEKTLENVKTGRAFLMEHLCGCCRAYPSDANFIMIDVAPKKSKDVTVALQQIGIIVRDCTSFRDAGDSLIRITVGTPAQNRQVVEALKRVLR